MQKKDTASSVEEESASKRARERVGLVVNGADASLAVSTIVAAEAAGVQQVWMIQTPSAPDTLTIFAAAALQTTSIRMGTAIVPTYPRHPLVMAQQALALGDLAPERLRLGIGPSHRPAIEGVYGIPMKAPLEHLREYVTVLRAALWEGKVDHQGSFFTIKATLSRTPRTPILISALGTGAFKLAGEISDGAISWMCPAAYLLEKALPALRAGAATSTRPAPPLLAHVPVALGQDRPEVLMASRKQISRYAHLPFYANMFANAGFPVGPDGTMSDELIDNLVVSGDEAAITSRLNELLAAGLDELLVMPILVMDPTTELERLMRILGGL
jgi:F420-dependent oxidoreductase-like protein